MNYINDVLGMTAQDVIEIRNTFFNCFQEENKVKYLQRQEIENLINSL